MIERLQIHRPHVPHGPVGVPDWKADADYLEHAAHNIAGGYSVGGHNVTATVINLLREVAHQLRVAGEAQERAHAAADALIAECEAEEAARKCALCPTPIEDGARLVSWFRKTGGETTERGSVHLECLTPAVTP